MGIFFCSGLKDPVGDDLLQKLLAKSLQLPACNDYLWNNIRKGLVKGCPNTERGRMSDYLLIQGGSHADGLFAPPRLIKYYRHIGQVEGHHGIPGGNSPVIDLFFPEDQVLLRLVGEEEKIRSPILEIIGYERSKFLCLKQIAIVTRDLLQLDQGGDQAGIVIQEGRIPGLPFLIGMIKII